MPHRLVWRTFPITAALATLTLQATEFRDPGQDLSDRIKQATGDKLELSFEFRSRIESRGPMDFGTQPELFGDFVRTRVGLTWTPSAWIRFSALGQDARAPLLGRAAPGNMRDPFDLQEGYVEFFPGRKAGLGFEFGRRMLQYGDTRLIGAPQWAWTARTYDMARASWQTSRARFEVLLISPIKPNGQGWNRPVLGDRVWGMYNTFTGLWRSANLDVYALRHDQNRPGGFSGPGRLQTNSYGFRWTGKISENNRFTAEAILQRGEVGEAPHAASAWVVEARHKRSLLRRQLETAVEYKYASGGDEPGRSRTFDQLYPAAHDKLGHVDVLGWRNVRNIKGTSIWAVTRSLSLTAIYSDSWLADRRDAAYNAQGRPIAVAPDGTAGAHIGREADFYGTWKFHSITIGGGGGYFFPGEFIRATTPGLRQTLWYVFQSYSF